MKAFKKVLCITLALMLAGLALMAPVAAATDVPLVVIQGFAAVPLVKNAGTEQEIQVFPPENLATDGNVAKLSTALITGFIEYGANGADWDSFGKRVLPIVKDMLAENKCTVKVLETTAKWFGVTYKEDKPGVVASVNELIKNGVYPETLWK